MKHNLPPESAATAFIPGAGKRVTPSLVNDMRRRLWLCLGVLSVLALLLTGCSSPGLKGTPYYSTETDQDARAAKERIPLWPIVYYRSPTLSVLWPFFEKSDEYMALRPLASVSGLDETRQVYSLLWPLGQFNRVEKENRFFPMFWGDGYVVAFPLYWHIDHPLAPDGGTDALIPLWFYSTDRSGYSFNVLWPVINTKEGPDGRGWRVWPLVGSYEGGAGGGYYRFAAWPFAHQWSSGKGAEQGEAVLPLYLRRTSREGSSFYSLLYSRHRGVDSGWDLILPLLYHSRTPEGSKTMTPLFFQGASADQQHAWQLLLPLYYSSRNEDRRTLVTLLGGMSRNNDGVGWAALPLLAGGLRRKDGTGMILSLPWSSASLRDGSHWTLVPPLMLKTDHGKDRSLFTPLVAAGTSHDGHRTWQTVIPLWYRSEEDGEKMVATLAGGWQEGADGRRWLIWPLLSGGHRGLNSRDVWVVAPLFHARWDSAGVSHHLLPVYGWDARDRRLISLVMATWGNAARGTKTTLVPPALTLYSSEPERKDLWTVAGAAHLSWGAKAGSSHVLPFYYRNKQNDTFISLPYAHWKDGASEHDLYPPLLSMFTKTGGEKRLDALLGLFSEEWGGDRREGYFLPFYYHETGRSFYTLPFGRNRDPESGFIYPLTPLVGVRTGTHSGGWLFPLWSRDHDKDRNETTGNILWGSYSRNERGMESSIFPLYGYRNRTPAPETVRSNAADVTYGKTFWSLPAIWYRNTVEVTPALDGAGRPSGRTETSSARGSGCFPLWSNTHLKSRLGGEETFGSLLMFLYDYTTTIKPGPNPGVMPQEHVRRRVLWRFWHYERHNETVSVDIFPAITYDRGAEGYRKWAFLWRAFRYEAGPEGRKMDLLFIPVWRQDAVQEKP